MPEKVHLDFSANFVNCCVYLLPVVVVYLCIVLNY